MRRSRLLVMSLVVGTGLAAALWLPTQRDTAGAATGGITFSDEFEASAGTAAGAARWTADTGGHGFGDGQLQFHTAGTGNAVHDGSGHLVITARRENPAGHSCHYGSCEYTSARLTTTGMFSQRHGRFEARLKLPRGRGLSPFFSLVGADGTVLDVLSHTAGDPAQRRDADPAQRRDADPAQRRDGERQGGEQDRDRQRGGGHTDAFRTYAVDWTPELIVWQVDGVEFDRAIPASLDGGGRNFDQPFALAVGLAVGGERSGRPDDADLPQSLTVDYVRVSAFDQRRPTAPTSPASSPTGIPSGGTPSTDAPTSAPTESAPTESAPTESAPTESAPAPTAPAAPTGPAPTSSAEPDPSDAAPTGPAEPTGPTAPPAWAPFTVYAAGQLVSFNGSSYHVQEPHTSLPGWEPPSVPALFAAR